MPDNNTPSKTEPARPGFWKRHLDKIGVGGSLFAALCCLGFPALLSILSAIGLGFLINDAVLRPLLLLFLVLTNAGLFLGMRYHKRIMALVAGILSAVFVYVFIFVSYHKTLAVIGMAGLIAASILNILLRQRQHSSCPADGSPNN